VAYQRAEDLGVLGQVPLGEGRHHATWIEQGHVETHRVAKFQFAAHPVVLWGIQLLISIYGGYFGAGIGILMLAAMGILIPSSMQHANALKILLALLTNGTACVLFTLSGKVNFQVAALMTVASLVGGWAGALLAKRLSPALMRGFAVVIGLAAAAKFLLS